MPILAWRNNADGFAFMNDWSLDATERAALTALAQPLVPAVVATVAAIIPFPDPIFLTAVAVAANAYTTVAPFRTYGLCAGMAYSALDHWNPRVPIPRGANRGDQPACTALAPTAIRDLGFVNLFDSNFMGSSTGSAGDPWLSAGFYDPTPNNPANRDVSLNPVDPPPDIPRTRLPAAPDAPPAPYSTAAQETAILTNVAYPAFRSALEDLHNSAHVYYANVTPHNAFRDPFVFLLHSNVDRIYAQWQTDPAYPRRLDPNTVYGTESNLDVSVPDLLGNIQIQNLTHLVEPWSTGVQVTENRPIRPWEPTHENQGMPHDYHHISVVTPPRYDTNQPLVNWTNMGKPPGVNLRAMMGAVTVMDTPASAQRAHVFVEGNDFNLWVDWWG